MLIYFQTYIVHLICKFLYKNRTKKFYGDLFLDSGSIPLPGQSRTALLNIYLSSVPGIHVVLLCSGFARSLFLLFLYASSELLQMCLEINSSVFTPSRGKLINKRKGDCLWKGMKLFERFETFYLIVVHKLPFLLVSGALDLLSYLWISSSQ